MHLASRQNNGALILTQRPLAHAVAVALLTMALGTTMTAPAHAQATAPAPTASKSYNIAAGSLSQVLYSFAGNAGITLSFEPTLTEGLRSNGLQGNYSVQQGLDTLLSTHNLEAVPGTGGGYRLRRVVQDASTLPAVNVATTVVSDVSPAYAGGQVARGGSLGLLGTQDVMNTPFSTNNYTAELMENQQVRTLADVVVNDASVRLTTGPTGFDDTFQIRGYSVGASDVGFNGLYGLVSSSRVPAQLIERVEVLKGPGSLINGIAPGGSVGGGVNVVSKRADDTPLTRLTAMYTGVSNFGLAIDMGRRFGDDNAWGIRFNGLVRDGEATISGGNHQSGLAAVGIDYRGSKFRWSLDAIAQRDDTDNFRPQISLLSGLSSIPAPPDARSNWYPGTTLLQKDSTIATRIEYDFTDSLMAYAGIGYRDGSNDQIFPGTTAAVNTAGNFTVRSNYYDSYTKTTSGNVGLRWKFKTASVGHTLTAAFTEMQQESANAYITGGSTTSNIYNPSPLAPITAARTAPYLSTDNTSSSFAIADTMSFMDDRLLLTLGARDQTVKSYNYRAVAPNPPSYSASSVSPLIGIVFKPVSNVSLFGNYTAGLSQGRVVDAQYDNRFAVLPPYKSKQHEAGIKVDWGKITTTASIYQITRPSSQVVANVYTFDGEQRNRGLELSAYGELQKGLRGMASVAFVDAKITRAATASTIGKDAAGVPDMNASASLDWDTPWVPGLALNGRVIYTAGSYLTTANTQKFDSWTRYDIGARYRISAGGKPIVLRANLENIFDKNYWLTTGTYVTVGAPRTLILSAAIDF